MTRAFGLTFVSILILGQLLTKRFDSPKFRAPGVTSIPERESRIHMHQTPAKNFDAGGWGSSVK